MVLTELWWIWRLWEKRNARYENSIVKGSDIAKAEAAITNTALVSRKAKINEAILIDVVIKV